MGHKLHTLANVGLVFAGPKKTKRFNKSLGFCGLCDKECFGTGTGFAIAAGHPEVLNKLPTGIKTKAFHTGCFMEAAEVFFEGIERAESYFHHN